MDQLAQVLLGLFNLSTKAPAAATNDTAERPALRLQHIDVVLSRLVEVLAPARTTQFEQARTTRAAQGSADAAGAIDLDRAVALIGEAEALVRSTVVDTTALQRIARTVDDITLLDAAIRLEGFASMAIIINHADFFDYLAELRFQSLDGHGHVVVVGRLPPNTSLLRIEGFADPSILRQIDVAYAATNPFPMLTLRNLQPRIRDQGFEPRQQWIQEDRPEADLIVYRRGQAHALMQIQTRTIRETRPIPLGTLQITLPVCDRVRLVATSLMSEPESPLVTYVRAV